MIPMKSGHAAHRIIEEEGFIVDTRSGVLHHLNPVAAQIWSWIDGCRREDELWRLVLENFDVAPDVARQDTLHFLGELKTHGLIEESPDAVRS